MICLAVACIHTHTHTHTHILQAERDMTGHERGRGKGRKPLQKGVGKEGDSVSEFVPRIILITVCAISTELAPPIVSLVNDWCSTSIFQLVSDHTCNIRAHVPCLEAGVYLDQSFLLPHPFHPVSRHHRCQLLLPFSHRPGETTGGNCASASVGLRSRGIRSAVWRMHLLLNPTWPCLSFNKQRHTVA